MNDTSKLSRMKELVKVLNDASKAYYAEDREIMSNFEYDKLYDELEQLETETGVQLANSPTVNVGYESVEELPKERHEKPMLSLGKTKEREELRSWLNGHEGLLSWKLDGLTVVLTYENGVLAKAVTRGNGEVGEIITANARCFTNLPLKISYTGKLILRGEAVISYSDFEQINEEIPEAENKYKNPRNLCSGSVRQLNSEVTAGRRVRFYAFSLVQAENVDFQDKRSKQFEFLQQQGFETVEFHSVTEDTILAEIKRYAEKIQTYDIPSDGLVLTYEEIAYGESLGMTAKFPRGSIAFKWADETAETTLKEIEWSPSRTGLINPVAVFEPVELEGTTVSRASVHNISVMRQLKLGIGDRITVYKANMIIPQIAENLTGSDSIEIPSVCPVCGGIAQVEDSDGHVVTGDVAADSTTLSLYCTNPKCAAKKIKQFTHFVSRNAMNMDGLSEQTLEKFIAKGFLHEYADLYHLENHREEICDMDGFGIKSYENLITSIETSRKISLEHVLFALGIPGIGLAGAKSICKHFAFDETAVMQASKEELSEIDGVGDVLAEAITDFFRDEEKLQITKRLLQELQLETPEEPVGEQILDGLTFVITGSLNHFENRDSLKTVIESLGGKVAGSVSSKTTALINNDVNSTSGKNKKAKEVGVEIIAEEEFLSRYSIAGQK